MSKLNIHCLHDTYTIRNDFDRSTWDGYNEESYDNHKIIYAIDKEPDIGYTDFTAEVERNGIYYFVYVLYTSGGTFGCTHGEFSGAALCNSMKQAQDLIKLIEEHETLYNEYRRSEEQDDRMRELEDILRVPLNMSSDYFYPPWIGYFESIDDCRIEVIYT